MSKQLIMVGSITYALKGRDLLRSMGYTTYIERTPNHLDRVGCGYSIYVQGDVQRASALLSQYGIPVMGISTTGDAV